MCIYYVYLCNHHLALNYISLFIHIQSAEIVDLFMILLCQQCLALRSSWRCSYHHFILMQRKLDQHISHSTSLLEHGIQIDTECCSYVDGWMNEVADDVNKVLQYITITASIRCQCKCLEREIIVELS